MEKEERSSVEREERSHRRDGPSVESMMPPLFFPFYGVFNSHLIHVAYEHGFTSPLSLSSFSLLPPINYLPPPLMPLASSLSLSQDLHPEFEPFLPLPFLQGNMGFPYHLFKRACNHPRTRSFRCGVGDGGAELYKTVNSVYLETSESWFTNSSEESFSTASEDDSAGIYGGDSEAEAVIRAARLDRSGGERRLFFEPGGGTSSIMEESKPMFKESVVLAMESKDPYTDFRQSMEEMVAIYGVKDWKRLEELLEWYLRVNGRDNHRFVVSAFVDLLLDLFAPPCSSSSSSRSLSLHVDEKIQEN